MRHCYSQWHRQEYNMYNYHHCLSRSRLLVNGPTTQETANNQDETCGDADETPTATIDATDNEPSDCDNKSHRETNEGCIG